MANFSERGRTISVLTWDKPGVLADIASLISKQEWNIFGLSVGPCEKEGCARFTILVEEENEETGRLAQEIGQLPGVITSEDISEQEIIVHELALVKVKVAPSEREQVLALTVPFRASINHVGPTTLILEVTGKREKVDAFIRLLRPFNIEAVNRSGPIAIPCVETPPELKTPAAPLLVHQRF